MHGCRGKLSSSSSEGFVGRHPCPDEHNSTRLFGKASTGLIFGPRDQIIRTTSIDTANSALAMRVVCTRVEQLSTCLVVFDNFLHNTLQGLIDHVTPNLFQNILS